MPEENPFLKTLQSMNPFLKHGVPFLEQIKLEQIKNGAKDHTLPDCVHLCDSLTSMEQFILYQYLP